MTLTVKNINQNQMNSWPTSPFWYILLFDSDYESLEQITSGHEISNKGEKRIFSWCKMMYVYLIKPYLKINQSISLFSLYSSFIALKVTENCTQQGRDPRVTKKQIN